MIDSCQSLGDQSFSSLADVVYVYIPTYQNIFGFEEKLFSAELWQFASYIFGHLSVSSHADNPNLLPTPSTKVKWRHVIQLIRQHVCLDLV